MGLYQRKPVEVEAQQYDGTKDSAGLILAWVNGNGGRAYFQTADLENGQLILATLNGEAPIQPTDWVVWDLNAVFSRMRNDDFGDEYEPKEV